MGFWCVRTSIATLDMVDVPAVVGGLVIGTAYGARAGASNWVFHVKHRPGSVETASAVGGFILRSGFDRVTPGQGSGLAGAVPRGTSSARLAAPTTAPLSHDPNRHRVSTIRPTMGGCPIGAPGSDGAASPEATAQGIGVGCQREEKDGGGGVAPSAILGNELA